MFTAPYALSPYINFFFFFNSGPQKVGPVGYPETTVRNYHPEDSSSLFLFLYSIKHIRNWGGFVPLCNFLVSPYRFIMQTNTTPVFVWIINRY